MLSYFALLMLVNHFRWDFVLIGVFVELLTLPALAAVGGLFGYSVYRSCWRKDEQRTTYQLSAAVLLVCITMLIVVSV